jgi:hypothetical protein
MEGAAMSQIVVGLYDDITRARNAVSELIVRGFDRKRISLLAFDPDKEYAQELEAAASPTDEDEVVAGASVGAVIGGLAGLLVGASAVALPGVGPVVVAGSITATLLGAGAGAAAGSLLGALMEKGVPEEEAKTYAEELRHGGTLVIAEVPESRVERAATVLERHHPIDVEKRAERWREKGWTGLQPGAKPRAAKAPEQGTGSQHRQELLGEEDFDYYLLAFHRHYEETYADTNQPFDAYEPAYYSGYELATNPEHRDCEWEDVQPQARQEWEEAHEQAWQDVKQAVIFSWIQVKRTLAASE